MASSFSVEFSEEARRDIRNICKYVDIKLNNPLAASNLSDKITSSAISLASFPKRFKVRKTSRDGEAVRYMPVDNFVLIYYVDDVRHLVNIVRVFYAKRDLDKLI